MLESVVLIIMYNLVLREGTEFTYNFFIYYCDTTFAAIWEDKYELYSTFLLKSQIGHNIIS